MQVSKVFLLNRILLPRVVLDFLLESVELGVELALTLTQVGSTLGKLILKLANLQDFKILSEVKSVQFKRLGRIDVSDCFTLIHFLLQVGVFGLSRQLTHVVRQLLRLGVSVLRSNLSVLVDPVRNMLDGLIKQFAPKDLTALL